ncbi:putative integrase [Cucumis melo var. makuwa]|uniref:Putative integrase n=1 Tax=Cucumis melo var. makuwa TaxID=1194695 RepID=A0A5D3BRE8_CUCMM|nr:putative integrase [Cucumis melo var. makuwa]
MRRQLEDSQLKKMLGKSKQVQKVKFQLRLDGAIVKKGRTKMCRTLKRMYWWLGKKLEIVEFVDRCLIYQQVKPIRQRPEGLLNPLPLPEWKWEHITMDFLFGLPRSLS